MNKVVSQNKKGTEGNIGAQNINSKPSVQMEVDEVEIPGPDTSPIHMGEIVVSVRDNVKIQVTENYINHITQRPSKDEKKDEVFIDRVCPMKGGSIPQIKCNTKLPNQRKNSAELEGSNEEEKREKQSPKGAVQLEINDGGKGKNSKKWKRIE